MGLLDKAKALADKAEQTIADDLKKVRGIASGDIDALIRSSASYAERLLTDAEKNLARQVFQETVPYDAVYLSNGLGLKQRAYTIPHPLRPGSYVIHIGEATFPDATNSAVIVLGQRADAVFIHELTHVWQGANRRHPLDYIFDSVYHQIREGSHAYDLNQDEVGKKSWSDFNAEQQAMIVENWYAAGMSESDAAFTYITNNIRARNP